MGMALNPTESQMAAESGAGGEATEGGSETLLRQAVKMLVVEEK